MAFSNNYEKKLFAKGLWKPLSELLASTTDVDKLNVHQQLSAKSIITITSAELTTLRSNILLQPTLAPDIGTRYRLTDGLLNGKVVEWNGEAFSTTGATFSVISKASSTQVGILSSSNSSADTTAVVLEEITIPGFLIGRKSKLRITPAWQVPNSATTKTCFVSVYTPASGDQSIAQNSTTTSLFLNHMHEWKCQDSWNSQKTANQINYGNTTNALLSSSADVRGDFNIRFKASWGAAAASETIYLLNYAIELLP